VGGLALGHQVEDRGEHPSLVPCAQGSQVGSCGIRISQELVKVRVCVGHIPDSSNYRAIESPADYLRVKLTLGAPHPGGGSAFRATAANLVKLPPKLAGAMTAWLREAVVGVSDDLHGDTPPAPGALLDLESFPIDVTGWEYATPGLNDYSELPDIRLELYAGDSEPTWNAPAQTIKLYLNAARTPPALQFVAKQQLTHELTHVAQYLLAIEKDLHQPGGLATRRHTPLGPDYNDKDPEVRDWAHTNADTELLPLVRDEVTEFNLKHKRVLEPAMRQSAARTWMASSKIFRQWREAIQFAPDTATSKHAEAKYKKAVLAFLRNVLADAPRTAAVRVAMPMPTKLPEAQDWEMRWVPEDPTNPDASIIRLTLVDKTPSVSDKFIAEVAAQRVEPGKWEIISAKAWRDGGWGAFCYEQLLKVISARGEYLASDRTVSDEATAVWDKYHARKDVDRVPYPRTDLVRYNPKEKRIAPGPRDEVSLQHAYRLRASLGDRVAGPLDWAKRQLGFGPKPAPAVGPSGAPIPPPPAEELEAADLVPEPGQGREMLPGGPDVPDDKAGQALHQWGRGEEVRVMGSDQLAGTFAMKDKRHRPLPQRPGDGAVFVPAGTKGIIKAVTEDSVMVLLGAPPGADEGVPPIGLYHLRPSDLHNSTPASARKRWASRSLGRLAQVKPVVPPAPALVPVFDPNAPLPAPPPPATPVPPVSPEPFAPMAPAAPLVDEALPVDETEPEADDEVEPEADDEAEPPPAVPLFPAQQVEALPAEAFQPHKDPAQLFAHAAETHELQLDFLDRGAGLAADIGAATVRGDLKETPDFDAPGPVVMIGPMKEMDRSSAKVARDYKGDWSKLNDVVRASIAVDTYAEVPGLLARLLGGVKLARKPKDRFLNPTVSGYRDVLLNVTYPNGHVGEVQIHVKSMLKAKKIGHKYYGEVREIEGAAEAEGRKTLTPEEQAIVDKANAKAHALYKKAWAEAQGVKTMTEKKKAALEPVGGRRYFEFGEFPAVVEPGMFPVVFSASGPRVVYTLETFFRESRVLTEEQFRKLRG